MSIWISGSMAYDYLMTFAGKFQDVILPEALDKLNVCFFAPQLRREFGGCAGNIAYNVHLLGGKGEILAAVGEDFAVYSAWLADNNISQDNIHIKSKLFTAQAFITSDANNQQLITFHPGAMDFAHEVLLAPLFHEKQGESWVIIAPNGRQAMIDHAAACVQQNMPHIFDPGQGLPMFDGDTLRHFIQQAQAVMVNEYECAMLCERTEWSRAEIAAQTPVFIVTEGAAGSVLYQNQSEKRIHVTPVEDVLDPTGCGDALRGGLLWALEKGLSWEVGLQLGSVLAAFNLAQHGTQNHRPSWAEIQARYEATYGDWIY